MRNGAYQRDDVIEGETVAVLVVEELLGAHTIEEALVNAAHYLLRFARLVRKWQVEDVSLAIEWTVHFDQSGESRLLKSAC